MRYTDAAVLSGTRRSSEGYLIAEAFAVRTGIQLYTGDECGVADKKIVRVWRPESEVKDVKSLATFTHAPVTMGHPTEMVTADNWSKLAKGEVSTEAEWVDGKIKLPLIIKDAQAISDVEAGTRQLSAGYLCDLSIESGITEDGQAYDAVQRNIRINHVAIVPRGRAGPDFRIGDNAVNWGVSPVTLSDERTTQVVDNALKTVVLGDSAVSVAVADVAAIEKFKSDSAKQLSDAKAANDAIMAAKDADLAKKDAQIAKLQAEALTDAALDARVQARGDLVAKAAKLAKDVVTAGLSDAAIKRAVVAKLRGADTVADKSEAYVDAAFDLLSQDSAAQTAADPLRGAVRDNQTQQGKVSAYDNYVAGLEDAHKVKEKV
jgi:hypothetical protein